MQVPPDHRALAGKLWNDFDARVQGLVSDHVNSTLGVARPRGMTIAVPLAGTGITGIPVPGWLMSVPIFQPVRITGWLIMALVQGSIQVDLHASPVQNSPSSVPPSVALNGSSNFLSLINGYSSYSSDTHAWSSRDIQAFSVIHVYIISAAAIQQAILGLQIQDLQGRTLQI